jgi:hypothetical protein
LIQQRLLRQLFERTKLEIGRGSTAQPLLLN